ncbi:MAG: hypothetical protein IIX85_05180, partial [Clostridia bacterium]|nr:hypothetical protein [Clostridia bacterium]
TENENGGLCPFFSGEKKGPKKSRGEVYFLFVRELFLILSSKRSLSDGKEEEERGTSVSLPCVKGGGPNALRLVEGLLWLTNLPLILQEPLSDGKTKNECGAEAPPFLNSFGKVFIHPLAKTVTM